MAWYEGTIGSAVGSLISVLDSVLPRNQYWSIHDAEAGTNKKVYKNDCSAKYSLFYLEVDNNYSGGALLRLWQNWDAQNHVGVGASTDQMRFNFSAGGYGVALNDTRLIFGAKVSGTCFYAGQLERIVETLNMPYLVAMLNTVSTTLYNGLGLFGDGDPGCKRRLLFGYSGAVNRQATVNWEGYAVTKIFKTPNGQVLLYKQPIIEANEKVVGFQDGVITIGTNTSEFANQDIIWEGDVGWLCFKSVASSDCCLVKMA
jgi:hypothetical protein